MSRATDRKEVRAAMGLPDDDERTQGIHWDVAHPNNLVFPQFEQSDAIRHLAARTAAGDAVSFGHLSELASRGNQLAASLLPRAGQEHQASRARRGGQ